MKKFLIATVSIFIVSCSLENKSTIILTDSTTVSENPDQNEGNDLLALKANAPELDIVNYKVYDYKDTSINFNKPLHEGNHEVEEPTLIKKDTRVNRRKTGLQFKLKNGKVKVLKDSVAEGDGYIRYYFKKPIDQIGQWLLLVGYYEGHGYLLIDQNNGDETFIWSEPAFSPDKKYFITGSADIEAGFVPNGFQLWALKNNKPLKVWERELNDWGADNLIWTSDNKIVGEQTFRDPTIGEANKRIVKMNLIWPSKQQ